MNPAKQLGLLFSACALLAGGIVASEGWVLKGYEDPVHKGRVPTACAGVTENVRVGQVFTEEECILRTAQAMVKHAAPIMKCVPDDITPEVLAVFADQSFNAGPGSFCSSSMSRKAMAGDWQGSCDAFLMWYRSGPADCRTDRRCRGLWTRRLKQRADCRAGAGLPVAPVPAWALK